MSKPNCYECKFRGGANGSSHSRCLHPALDEIIGHPMLEIAAIMGGVGLEGGPLEIKGSEHGKRKGWFAWPVNFDPIWLESCNGFQAKGRG
jgi:hypothetical protein